MADQIEWVALSIFMFFFVLVTVMGFFAARWKAGPVSEHLDEWGLGGRQFGTWITWFLVGGDFYTAYTVIAVPALVYAVGAYGFFALPYTIIVYPFRVRGHAGAVEGGACQWPCHRGRRGPWHLRFARPELAVCDHRHGRDHALHRAAADRDGRGDQGDGPDRRAADRCRLHHSGVVHLQFRLRAPALIAFVKDIMIYIVVLVAVVVVPAKLGGYGAVFAAASDAFAAKGGDDRPDH